MRWGYSEVLNVIKGTEILDETATTPPSQTQLNQALAPRRERTICIIYQKGKIT